MLVICCLATVVGGASPAFGQVLYSQNFDVDGQASQWTLVDGPTDESADYFFDYSTVGIPAAPNSGGTTRGMKIQANMTDAVFGGSSTSPNGQSFTGDYKLTFDLWSNYLGGDPDGIDVIGTTTGSTMLSLYGIETSGTVANRAGSTDGIFFANTGDISSSAFRVYSIERVVSYQLPHLIGDPPDPANFDNQDPPQPIDSHATYHAGTRSNNPATGGGMEVFYQNAFPSVEVPAAQTAMFPETQHGSTVAGSVGFAWHEVEIAKSGNTVTWTVDGTLLITLDTTNFVVPTAGENIFFGHADINAGISADPYYPQVSFTLVDNIAVSAITQTAEDADFDNDNDVDGDDFLIWQRTVGVASGAGDADGDGVVDGDDLAIWMNEFAQPQGAAAAGGAVPEPAAASLAAAAVILGGRLRRKRLANIWI
jgi:hypothetical protein